MKDVIEKCVECEKVLNTDDGDYIEDQSTGALYCTECGTNELEECTECGMYFSCDTHDTAYGLVCDSCWEPEEEEEDEE